jgi:hypothetical protein
MGNNLSCSKEVNVKDVNLATMTLRKTSATGSKQIFIKKGKGGSTSSSSSDAVYETASGGRYRTVGPPDRRSFEKRRAHNGSFIVGGTLGVAFFLLLYSAVRSSMGVFVTINQVRGETIVENPVGPVVSSSEGA